jgi:hypothetical protein
MSDQASRGPRGEETPAMRLPRSLLALRDRLRARREERGKQSATDPRVSPREAMREEATKPPQSGGGSGG